MSGNFLLFTRDRNYFKPEPVFPFAGF